MNADAESQVLAWFERVLELPAGERAQWLHAQSLPDWLQRRVQRLLDAEAALDDDFLAQPPVSPVARFPRAGDRLGNYELLRELDAGGMGVVFLARRADDAYQQQVAVKLIRPLHLQLAPGMQRALVARFENERALLARLAHPNIARILDGGSTDDGIPYLVMEYVDGLSLTAYCDAHALGVHARLRLFARVCEGVQEAHRHLIVHRDLKPENILVAADGEPRLLDFGIARALGDGPGIDGATALTAMTPAYASPEQVRRQPLTTSSDVYSLGVVLYQLVTGRRPYELAGLSPADAERTVCDTSPATLRDALRRQGRAAVIGIADLDRIVARAMHKEPTRRYGSAGELAADVQRWLDGRPVFAHPDSGAYRLRKFIGRHRIGSAAAAFAALAILASAGIASWQARQARRAADDMRQVNAFLTDVLEMSDPFAAGSELTLSQALDGAAKNIDQRFADRPDLSSEIRFGIGYSMLGRYKLDAAETQLVRALRESEAAFGHGDIRTLRVIEALAGLRQEQDRGAEAERLYLDGISGIERAGLADDPLYVDLLNNLGNLYLTEEKYAQADRWLKRAASHLDMQVASANSAGMSSNLAQAAHGLKDYDRADQLYRQAQAMYEKLFPDGSPDLAIVLNNRALLAEDRGRQREALDLHRQSLAMRRKVFKGDHPMIVVAQTNVARKSLELGDIAGAMANASEAAAMADRVYTEPNGRHVAAWATLAQARLASGDQAGAVVALSRARALLATVDSPAAGLARQMQQAQAAICGGAAAGTACATTPTAAR